MSERKWCEHMAEGWIDNCPDCRIAKLEAEAIDMSNAYAVLEDKYNSALEERNAYKLRADQRPALKQLIAELEQDKQNVREWTRKHRALISYVAETHSIPAFMLEELNDTGHERT
jgi:hypothetical protein